MNSPQTREALKRAIVTFAIAMIPVLEAFTTGVLDPNTAALVAGTLFALGRVLEGIYDTQREVSGDIQLSDVGATSAPISPVVSVEEGY